VAFGLAVIGIGVLALLDRMNAFGLPLLRTFWPLALVVVGIGRLTTARHPAHGLFGAALIAAGTALVAHKLGWIHIHPGDWWPVIVIVVGAAIVLKGVWPSPRRAFSASTLEHGERVAIEATFAGVNQQNDSPSFQGGRIDVSFGGVELDLRQAAMTGPEAVLEIAARFSAIELRVPREWLVVVDVSPTFGNVEDKTTPPLNPAHRLVVRGDTVFGGIEIKN
jgi:predicted membrane protein